MPVNEHEVGRLAEEQRLQGLDIATLKAQVFNLTESLKTFVTRAEFTPVKIIAYGFASAVLGMVMTALIAKVIVK